MVTTKSTSAGNNNVSQAWPLRRRSSASQTPRPEAIKSCAASKSCLCCNYFHRPIRIYSCRTDIYPKNGGPPAAHQSIRHVPRRRAELMCGTKSTITTSGTRNAMKMAVCTSMPTKKIQGIASAWISGRGWCGRRVLSPRHRRARAAASEIVEGFEIQSNTARRFRGFDDDEDESVSDCRGCGCGHPRCPSCDMTGFD